MPGRKHCALKNRTVCSVSKDFGHVCMKRVPRVLKLWKVCSLSQNFGPLCMESDGQMGCHVSLRVRASGGAQSLVRPQHLMCTYSKHDSRMCGRVVHDLNHVCSHSSRRYDSKTVALDIVRLRTSCITNHHTTTCAI